MLSTNRRKVLSDFERRDHDEYLNTFATQLQDRFEQNKDKLDFGPCLIRDCEQFEIYDGSHLKSEDQLLAEEERLAEDADESDYMSAAEDDDDTIKDRLTILDELETLKRPKQAPNPSAEKVGIRMHCNCAEHGIVHCVIEHTWHRGRDHELHSRYIAGLVIRAAAIELQLDIGIALDAVWMFHRFYFVRAFNNLAQAKNNFHTHPPDVTAISALHLACKSVGVDQGLGEVITAVRGAYEKAANMKFHRTDRSNWLIRELARKVEVQLLVTVRYQAKPNFPLRLTVFMTRRLITLLDPMHEILGSFERWCICERSYAFYLDLNLKPLITSFRMAAVVCTCIECAFEVCGYELPAAENGNRWFELFNVARREVIEIKWHIWEIYDHLRPMKSKEWKKELVLYSIDSYNRERSSFASSVRRRAFSMCF